MAAGCGGHFFCVREFELQIDGGRWVRILGHRSLIED